MTRNDLHALQQAGVITHLEADAYWLHETKRLTLRQIAAGQNVAHSTIHARIQRARRKITAHTERKAA